MNTTTTVRIVAGLMVILVFLPIFVIPYWKIFSKAGFAGALSLLMTVPFVNLIVLYGVAFSEWNAKPVNTPVI
jgi:hypothetical protein